MTPLLDFVRPGGTLPYGAAALAAAIRSHAQVVVLGSQEEPGIPEQRILDLLTGSFGIGAVVPQPGGDNRLLPARDVDVPVAEMVAARADLLHLAEIDPHENEPGQVIAAVLNAARQRRLRVVCDPGWIGEGQSHPDRRQATPIRILLIAGRLSNRSLRAEERSVRDLIRSLDRQCRHADLTVLTVERSRQAADGWRAEGVRVLEGPADWDGLASREAGAYSHVVVTPAGLRAPARRWIESSQPQAAKVLFFPSLAFREITALAPVVRPEELAGLELARVEVERRTAEQVRWADIIWCEHGQDASFVRGLLPDKEVVVLPPAIEAHAVHRPLAERRGVVVAAVEGHDVVAANEDAALRILEEIIPALRQRHPALECTVVSSSPTPMLQAAVAAAGARRVPDSQLATEVASTRVLLAAHTYGTGQPEVIMNSLAAGTPFVITRQAAGGLDLGPLQQLASFSDPADITARAAQLLSDAGVWHHFVGVERQLLDTQFGQAQRTSILRGALAGLGITPGPSVARWPCALPPPATEMWRPAPQLDLRPGSAKPSGTSGIDLPEPTTERERYVRWVAQHGPTPETLHALRAAVEQLTYRPLISVVMPVHNTDRAVLLEAIDSVRAQIYEHWQLCIANDGSTRPETLDVLASLKGDPAVRVVDLPGGSGISGATNSALTLAEGEFIALLDHDDVLKPHALAQVARWIDANRDLDLIYSDEDKLDEEGGLYDPHIKPDWSPDQLTAQNYVCHLTVARTALVNRIGGFRSAFDGSQDYDLILRLTEETDRIAHIPEPLYSWRAVPGSAAAEADAKPYAIEAAGRALSDALIRRGYDGRVDTTRHLGHFQVRYPLPGRPRVSIIIPTKDGVGLLRRCIGSVIDRSTYGNYELLIIDNQSSDGETLAYLADFPGRVIRYPHRFNYARMMNLASRSVECDALLFLNNDTEVISPNWIESLLEHAMRPEVGAVGCRLFLRTGEPQHEGILVGVGGGWAHNLNHRGYWARGDIVRNVSAVTGACTMIRPEVFWRVGGNDERLRIAYNDVDLCLRIRQAGYEVVYTPAAELYHYESSTRGGYEHYEDGPLFGLRWHPKESGDPYYSPVFEINRPFQIKV